MYLAKPNQTIPFVMSDYFPPDMCFSRAYEYLSASLNNETIGVPIYLCEDFSTFRMRSLELKSEPARMPSLGFCL